MSKTIPAFPNIPSWHRAQLKVQGQLYIFLYLYRFSFVLCSRGVRTQRRSIVTDLFRDFPQLFK